MSSSSLDATRTHLVGWLVDNILSIIYPPSHQGVLREIFDESLKAQCLTHLTRWPYAPLITSLRGSKGARPMYLGHTQKGGRELFPLTLSNKAIGASQLAHLRWRGGRCSTPPPWLEEVDVNHLALCKG